LITCLRKFFFAKKILFGSFLLIFHLVSTAQTIPVGSLLDEAMRSIQLTGKLDSLVSFTVRPLASSAKIPGRSIYSFIDSAELGDQPSSYVWGKYGQLTVLPVTLIQQYNTHHPYGWNDGAMIAAKGYQTLVSAGLYASIGPLELQLQPELVYAANPSYETTNEYGTNPIGSYSKVFLGQSSIRLTVGAVSAGLSTENLWWGPGIHSSLLMSNNAPGFLHGFFSSKKPVKSGIGSFEWQLIGAKLTSNNTEPYENYNLKTAFLTGGSRYLSAFVVTYHPKWVPGLFLGMTRALQRYKQDIILSGSSLLSQYIPVLVKPFQKQNAQSDDTMHTDQLASFFLRWVLPKTQMEFYIEYGYNDYGQNIRDYVMSPTHSAAYIIGFKKILELKQNDHLDLGFEMTQMSQSPDYLVRDAGNWYVHSQLKQGYTSENQILGAGAGLGCNVQTATATWVKGWKQLGVLFERVERDPLYHPYKWIDLSIGILPQYKYKNMVLSGLFQFINSSQYAWQQGVNRFNLHSRLSIQYFL